MPRRSAIDTRPHDHLLAAARVASRIEAAEPHPSESGDAESAPAEETKSQRRARAQHRNRRGEFA